MIQADQEIALAREMFLFYRARGFNPLPSREDEKRPIPRFRQYWDARAPESIFDEFLSPNLQVMTGRAWRLLVIDLDGPEAIDVWPTLCKGKMPRTWSVRSGGGGQHLWFRLPKDFPRELPVGQLWKGNGKHSQIDRLCDRSLVVAPPSRYTRPDGSVRRYEFDPGCGPRSIPLPAPCPDWLLEMPTIADLAAEKRLQEFLDRPLPPRVERTSGRTYNASDVRDAIPDKALVARDFGLVLSANRPNPSGWWPCHAYDRPDDNPSAAIHNDTGVYVDRGSGTKLRFFDLLAQLGAAPTWEEVCDLLGDRFHCTPQ